MSSFLFDPNTVAALAAAVSLVGIFSLWLGAKIYPTEPVDETSFRLPDDDAERSADRRRALALIGAGLLLLLLAGAIFFEPTLRGREP